MSKNSHDYTKSCLPNAFDNYFLLIYFTWASRIIIQLSFLTDQRWALFAVELDRLKKTKVSLLRIERLGAA